MVFQNATSIVPHLKPFQVCVTEMFNVSWREAVHEPFSLFPLKYLQNYIQVETDSRMLENKNKAKV